MDSGEQFRIGYQCLGCGEIFLSSIALIEHMSAWQRMDSCPIRLINLCVQRIAAVDAEREQFYVHRINQSVPKSPLSSDDYQGVAAVQERSAESVTTEEEESLSSSSFFAQLVEGEHDGIYEKG